MQGINFQAKLQERHFADFNILLLFHGGMKTQSKYNDNNLVFAILYSCLLMQNG